MKNRLHITFYLLAGVLSLPILTVSAQNPATGQVWVYRLLEGSLLTRDSLIGGLPALVQPLRGTLALTLQTENPLFATYQLTNIAFTSAGSAEPSYLVTGTGIYQVGGEVALFQDMQMEALVGPPSGQAPRTFTNAVRQVIRRWPVLEIELAQTDANPLFFYRLHLLAAPVRDIWFSTASGLTAGIWDYPTNHVSGGDLLSLSGHLVKRNLDLAGQLGIMPMVPDLGLAAIEVATGGEMLWAADQAVFSELLGPIQQGDMLSNRGQIVKRNQALLAAFGLGPKAADVGLDALQTDSSGEIFFSIRTNVYSPSLGVMLVRGDLLSDRGRKVKTNQELLARFQPADAKMDYGLDALYLWPSGEIWFSTEEGFMDQQLGQITSGDLLSDDGYIVFRNLEMVGAFQPLEDLANFGLDAVFVVTDVVSPAPPCRISGVLANSSSGDLTIRWEGTGKVFQVEKAGAVDGTYRPLGPIIPDMGLNDMGALGIGTQSFYRIRQW